MRALELLREQPMSTLDFHASYILAAACVVRRLRLAGHVIVNNPLPNGVALYTLLPDRKPASENKNAPGSAARCASSQVASNRRTPELYERTAGTATETAPNQ